jgi:hypothetical protein
VLKKLFKALAAVVLLVGCYFGYVRAFVIVVQQFKVNHRTNDTLFVVRDSNSKRTSIANAKSAYGSNHWSAAEDLGYRYYNAERGYWIYAREAVRVVEEDGVRYDGKRMRLKPFALIMKSRDGRNTKTITSDVAVIDLNAPLSFSTNPDGEPLKIKHAHLEQNVLIRDDKSTPLILADDMTIDPLNTLDYDEPTQQIMTDSHVVIRDPDLITSGDAMLIQLWKDDEPRRPGSSSGFEGAERMDLMKNVHVVMRDVGKSGFMPGSAAPPRPGKKTAEVSLEVTGTDPRKPKPAPPVQPTPLDVRCDSKMQVFLPKPKPAVTIGPPEAPAPTLVQFDRNVVVLRGELDERPEQLTCDTLKLTLVPGDKPPEAKAKPPADQDANASSSAPALAGNPASLRASATGDAKTKNKGGSLVQTETSSRPDSGSDKEKSPDSNSRSGGDQGTSLFGNLVLQRAHATGHAVWLSLPGQGIKLRCNELIHLRLAPFAPDKTYFRGDLTRPLELEKIDVVDDEEDPHYGEVTSVTHIRTVDATMYDRGLGTDAADVVANGPGRLETRPGRDQPVERIAIWQDKFYLQNEIGPEGQILRKLILLTGKRPCFIDQAKKSSLDSAYLIKIWLKPKPKPASASPEAASSPSSLAGRSDSDSGEASSVIATPAQSRLSAADAKNAGKAGTQPGSGLGGGNFDIERLLALRDVHLLAPAKTMTARERLDAEFVEPEQSPPAAAASPAKVSVASSPTAAAPEQATKQETASTTSPAPVAAQAEPEQPPAEPAMVGSAERIWVKLEMKPVKVATASSSTATATTDGSADQTSTASANTTKSRSTGRPATETNAEIRKAWLLGSVDLHQDPAEGKKKGQDASGEAVYIDNRGEGKVISYIYQRDPNEKTYLPGPLPPARVENDDKTIEAAGVINMNQGTDQAWVEGPGKFTQRSERPASAAPAPTDVQPAVASTSGKPSSGAQVALRPASLVSRNDGAAGSTKSKNQAPAAKPKTRAGLPLSDIVTTTIQFSEGMEFTGRTTDPKGNPAARADFHGIVTALMEDALLHCEETMIAYTDQVVPLAQLGAMSKSQTKSKTGAGIQSKTETAADPADEQPKPQLALIECYRNAVLINREVDPDRPILIQKKRVEAEEVLFYDRRTGDFTIPGKGMTLLYDRSDGSKADGANPEGAKNPTPDQDGIRQPATPALRRTSNTPSGTTGASSAKAKSKTSSSSSRKSAASKAEEIPSLVLTKITFGKGMRSQPGTGDKDDKLKIHWYEFFGDVQLGRAKVPDGQSTLDFDNLPSDGIFLTGQTVRFITEPPPVGAPASAPGRDFGKAWENAYFTNGENALSTDVITYESEKDLVYAYGEGGRGVSYAQQRAAGQPASQGTARALRYHPKSGSMDLLDNSSIQLIDKNTGARPVAADAFDPDMKKKKPPKKGFRVPASNLERRGFTGQ